MPTKPPPREHLDPRARTLWRISGLVGAVPMALVAAAAAYLLIRTELVPTWAAVAVASVVTLAAAVGVWPYPDLLWRHWRYEIGEAEVDLQHGWWTVTRTLIPMARIQHVDTRRGPLQRRFGLASVVLYTAAGASEIPALADDVAAEARDRIAALANTVDEL
ncbi:MAG: PH domain-containing protein [Chloroflexota bacterium]|nr:PH domain-containing protein [Chloroflexota bacterium]